MEIYDLDGTLVHENIWKLNVVRVHDAKLMKKSIRDTSHNFPDRSGSRQKEVGLDYFSRS